MSDAAMKTSPGSGMEYIVLRRSGNEKSSPELSAVVCHVGLTAVVKFRHGPFQCRRIATGVMDHALKYKDTVVTITGNAQHAEERITVSPCMPVVPDVYKM